MWLRFSNSTQTAIKWIRIDAISWTVQLMNAHKFWDIVRIKEFEWNGGEFHYFKWNNSFFPCFSRRPPDFTCKSGHNTLTKPYNRKFCWCEKIYVSNCRTLSRDGASGPHTKLGFARYVLDNATYPLCHGQRRTEWEFSLLFSDSFF